MSEAVPKSEILDEMRTLRAWMADELGDWLPVEPHHYPSELLVRIRENYDKADAMIERLEKADA